MTTLIIDTRESFEYATGHVAGAINIPPGQFMTGDMPTPLKVITKQTELILYCRSGSRSNVVGHILRQQGFTNIVNGTNQGHVEKLLASRQN